MLIKNTQNGITMMVTTDHLGKTYINFRYVNPSKEADGERLIAALEAFIAENAGWALIGNTPATLTTKREGVRDFMRQTRNHGVLWAALGVPEQAAA